MNKQYSQTEVEAIFSSMDLPLIERSIEEIREAKERFVPPNNNSERSVAIHRLIVSNGTGQSTKDKVKHAQLERRPL